MQKITIPNNWQPRPYQLPVMKYFDEGGRRAVLKWHRRSGKDDLALHLTAKKMLDRVGTYWHVLPYYEQARKAIWDAVDPTQNIRRIDWAFPKELRARTNDQEMKIVFKNGSVWQLVGSDKYNNLVGANVAGIVFSEYALCRPEAWNYLSPILEENNGWALFISTVRGKNHFTDLFNFAGFGKGWFGSRVNADESGVFSAEQLERIKEDLCRINGKQLGLQVFQQEYFNDENAVTAVNAVFEGEEIASMRRPQPINKHKIGRVGGIDVARFGRCENIIHILDVYADDTVIEFDTISWQGMDATFTQGKIFDAITRYGIDVVNIDCDGLGGPILDNVRQFVNNIMGVNPTVKYLINEYHNTRQSGPYANATTENYFKAKELTSQGKVYLKDENTITQLGERKFFYNGAQKMLESKKEWATGEEVSPDRADAHVMAIDAKKLLRPVLQEDVGNINRSYDLSSNFGY